MNCYLVAGSEWHGITAALRGDVQMLEAQQELLDGYVAFYERALTPYTNAGPEELHLCCVGFIGAAEAISREMPRGQTTPQEAASTLTHLITRSLQPNDSSLLANEAS